MVVDRVGKKINSGLIEKANDYHLLKTGFSMAAFNIEKMSYCLHAHSIICTFCITDIVNALNIFSKENNRNYGTFGMSLNLLNLYYHPRIMSPTFMVLYNC